MDSLRHRALQCFGSALKRPSVSATYHQIQGRHQLRAFETARAISTTPGSDCKPGEGWRRINDGKSKKPVTGGTSSIASTTPGPNDEPVFYKDSFGLNDVKLDKWPSFDPAFLRDACKCEKCVDPSSKQKNFQTSDIPDSIRATSVSTRPDGSAEIVWENDILGFEPDHKSQYSSTLLRSLSDQLDQRRSRFSLRGMKLWNEPRISKVLDFLDYEQYMETEEGLFRAVQNLDRDGLLVLRGVPASEKSVETIALRIGSLRDSLYGRTWDVRSVPQAKNVAYTAQHLGLHMDLLYMANPPGFQFLHCLENTCEGGSSLFSDAIKAASTLPDWAFKTLCLNEIPYHYRTAGEHYYFRHPLIEIPPNSHQAVICTSTEKDGRLIQKLRSERNGYIRFVNYSPPFQADHVAERSNPRGYRRFPIIFQAMKAFAQKVESPENLYEYRLQKGECVIFNNRRILHGRKQFDTTTGSRWLRGAYIDTDVFMSKYRILHEKFQGPFQSFDPKTPKENPQAALEASG